MPESMDMGFIQSRVEGKTKEFYKEKGTPSVGRDFSGESHREWHIATCS